MEHVVTRSSRPLLRRATKLLIGAVAAVTAISMLDHVPLANAQEDPVSEPAEQHETHAPLAAADTDPSAEPRPSDDTEVEPSVEPTPSENVEPEPTREPAPVEPTPTETVEETPSQLNERSRVDDRMLLQESSWASCSPGQFYSIQTNGSIRQITSGGQITTFASAPNQGTSFNGLALTGDGSTMYGYSRTQNNLDIYRWTETGVQRVLQNAPRGGFNGTNFIAGAFDNASGKYFYGVYSTSNQYVGFWPIGYTEYTLHFHLFSFDPATEQAQSVGSVQVDSSRSELSPANGDFAFSATGDLFLLRSDSGTNPTAAIYTISGASINSGNPQIVARTNQAPVNLGGTAANGVAVDSDGTVIIGTGNQAFFLDPSNGFAQVPGRPTLSGLGSSTDLASCQQPPTITVIKELPLRADAEDQFTISIATGNEPPFASVTTEGASTSTQLGPVIARTNQSYRISETIDEGPSALEDYQATWACVFTAVGGSQQQLGSGSGFSFQISTPNQTGDTVCTITNATKNAGLIVDKEWAVNGTVYQHGDQPEGLDTQLTVNGSSLAWGDVHGGLVVGQLVNLAETVTISSELAHCTVDSERITRINGDAASHDFSNGYAHRLTATGQTTGQTENVNSILVRNTVTCDSTLTLEKELLTQFDPDAGVDQWLLQADGPTTGVSGVTDSAAVTDVAVEPGQYTLSESLLPDYGAKELGYVLESLVCVDRATGTDVPVDADQRITIGVGADVVCTFTNKDLPGSVTWDKIAAGSGVLLSGSEWLLTGPGSDTDGIEVVDFEGTAPNADGPDQDGAAGAFLLEDLVWGDYTLVEARAPAGYQLSGEEIAFTIGPVSDSDTLHLDLGSVENQQRDALAIPLTGGLGADLFFIIGAVLVALALAALIWHRRKVRTLTA